MDQFEIDIVTASLGESIFTDDLCRLGVKFYELSGNQRRVIRNDWKFADLMWKRQYDVLHLNAFQGLSLRYLWLAKRAGVPVRIAHSHNTALRKSITRPLKLMIHFLARRLFARSVTDFWACSRLAAEFLFSSKVLEKRGYTCIFNGIDTVRFAFQANIRKSLRADLGLSDAYVIGNVGRLCSQKNQMFLLDVLYTVVQREPMCRLLLGGEGEMWAALEKKAKQLNIEKNVIFYGVSDHIERLLWAMDVLAFPSLFEGLGIAVVEAQAAGLPVIVSEFVPEEAQVTENVQMIPISDGTVGWAEGILTCCRRTINRKSAADTVRQSGFDIADTVRQVCGAYKQ